MHDINKQLNIGSEGVLSSESVLGWNNNIGNMAAN